MAFPFPSRNLSASPAPASAFGAEGFTGLTTGYSQQASANRTNPSEFSTPSRASMGTPDMADYGFPPPPSPLLDTQHVLSNSGTHSYSQTSLTGSSGRATPGDVHAGHAAPAAPQMTARKEALKSWADRIAGQLSLTNVQLSELHFLVDLGKNMDPGQLQIQLWQIAHQYHVSNSLDSIKGETAKLAAVIEDLKTLSDTTFKLSDHQDNYLQRQAKHMVFDPKRTQWMSMHDELELHVKEVEGFRNIVGNDWCEKELRAQCKDRTGSARNQFRAALFESLAGPKKCTLEEATYRMAQKFRRGGPGASLEVDYQIHVALLMGHFFEVTTVDADGTVTVTKKRKGSGKVSKGEDYWSLADTWMADKVARWGTDMKGPRWQEYIQETLRQDIHLYKQGPGTLMEALPTPLARPSIHGPPDNQLFSRIGGAHVEPGVWRNTLSVMIE